MLFKYMIGNYVKLNGQLVRLEDELYGIATVKVIKTGQLRDVHLSMLEPIKLNVVRSEEREIEDIGVSSNGRTTAFDSVNSGSNPGSPAK